MIEVRVFKNNQLIDQIIIEGHANYDVSGKDIVCAGVSAIGVGAINALEKIINKKPAFAKEDGYLLIKFDLDSSSQIIANTMLIQLQTIEDSYKKYLKIIYS